MDLLGHPYLMIIERGHVPLCADDYGKDADPEAEGGERDDLPPGQSCTCAALSKTPPKKLQLKGTVSRDGFGFWWHEWLQILRQRLRNTSNTAPTTLRAIQAANLSTFINEQLYSTCD